MQSSWLDSLDELHSDPDFGVLEAAVDGMQQHKLLASGGSDLETLSAFLDEMEQLDTDALMSFENAPSDEATLHQHPHHSVLAAAVAPPVRKKTISSTERRKRDKAQLLERLVQLQLQLQGLQTEQQQMNPQYERQREQRETLRALDTNSRIKQALTLEQSRSSEVALLLNHLRTPMHAMTYSAANPGLESAQDGATFEMLRRNISENYALLAQEWEDGSIPFATNEALDVATDPDENAITFKSARLFPFSISTISDTLWRVAQTGFQSDSFKTVSLLEYGMIASKEQLTIHPAGHNAITLCVRAAMKRIVRELYVVFMWETVCEWSTPSSSPSSTTQDSGWALIRPVNVNPERGVSVMQSQMKMTLVDSSIPWTQLMQKSGVMLPIIIPSSQQVMLDRIQHLENCLMDDALLMSLRR